MTPAEHAQVWERVAQALAYDARRAKQSGPVPLRIALVACRQLARAVCGSYQLAAEQRKEEEG